jgi:hypothetical protein
MGWMGGAVVLLLVIRPRFLESDVQLRELRAAARHAANDRQPMTDLPLELSCSSAVFQASSVFVRPIASSVHSALLCKARRHHHHHHPLHSPLTPPHTRHGRLPPSHPHAPRSGRSRAALPHFRRHACLPRPEEPAHPQVDPKSHLPDQCCPTHSPSSSPGHQGWHERRCAHSRAPPCPRQLPLELREVRHWHIQELNATRSGITNCSIEPSLSRSSL